MRLFPQINKTKGFKIRKCQTSEKLKSVFFTASNTSLLLQSKQVSSSEEISHRARFKLNKLSGEKWKTRQEVAIKTSIM